MLGCCVGFAVRAVNDERADRDAWHKLRHTAYVVVVIVSDQHVVDVAEARALRSCDNAIGVAVVIRPASVDQQRLSRGGDEERRLPTLYIDEVDLQLTVALADACDADARQEGRRANSVSLLMPLFCDTVARVRRSRCRHPPAASGR